MIHRIAWLFYAGILSAAVSMIILATNLMNMLDDRGIFSFGNGVQWVLAFQVLYWSIVLGIWGIKKWGDTNRFWEGW